MNEHWSGISNNPVARDSLEFVSGELRRCYRGVLPSYLEVMRQYTEGKSVLDIGVVEHCREFIDSPDWKHRIIKTLARRAVGCDILKDEVTYLRTLGLDIRLVDATSSADLGEKFETVYIGDVIEHVNDASALLRFAGRHAQTDGEIVVTTPCPFWWKTFASCIKRRPFVGNVDHVCWVTPFNAMELAHRAGLSFVGYHLVQNLGRGPLTATLHRLRRYIGLQDSEIFSWAYVYNFRTRA